MPITNDKVNDEIQLKVGAIQINWQGVHETADAVKEAATNLSNRLQYTIDNTAVRFNAVKTEGENAANHIADIVKESAQEVKSQIDQGNFKTAAQLAGVGLSRVGEAVRKGANKVGNEIQAAISQVTTDLQKLAANTQADANHIGASLNTIKQNIQLSDVDKSLNLSSPPDSQSELNPTRISEIVDNSHMEMIKALYRKRFPNRNIDDELVFESEQEMVEFLTYLMNNNFPPFLGKMPILANPVYIGVDGWEKVQASYQAQYFKYLQTVRIFKKTDEYNLAMAKNNEDIAQDYVQYITGKRYDEDQPSERSLSIAPDGINAQEKGIFRFDKIENPLEFFQWQAEQNRHFFMHSAENSKDASFFISIGDGNLYRGTFSEVRQQLADEYLKNADTDINKALIQLETYRPIANANQQQLSNLSPMSMNTPEEQLRLKK